jgi:murein DD-endopeptidase / murein LD-carboxypeptidase
MRCIGKWCVVLFVLLSCGKPDKKDGEAARITSITTGKITPSEVIGYARSLAGVPYKYGSIDPKQGFDCSGFITCVFNHFGIRVPRTSVDFTFVGRDIALNDARPGDLVLFTGTDTTTSIVGHMGILVSSPGEEFKFIHCTSGKSRGVTETTFYSYYIKRYVKTIRVFPLNDLLPMRSGCKSSQTPIQVTKSLSGHL